jgi:dihydrofolate reductase
MTLSLIWAQASNGVIGRNGALPWRLPADLARFKRLTMGHHLIMGRKTWESIGKPLPGRTSVVLTRSPDFQAPPGVLVCHDLGDAVLRAESNGDAEPFVIGGAEVYAAALPRADRLYRTFVEHPFEGDARFDPDLDGWRQTGCELHLAGDGFPHSYAFETWERR